MLLLTLLRGLLCCCWSYHRFDHPAEVVVVVTYSIAASARPVKIAPFATPDYIQSAPGLPKTRSGKIMRRVLKKIANDEKDLGDISTMADPTVVEVTSYTSKLLMDNLVLRCCLKKDER